MYFFGGGMYIINSFVLSRSCQILNGGAHFLSLPQPYHLNRGLCIPGGNPCYFFFPTFPFEAILHIVLEASKEWFCSAEGAVGTEGKRPFES